jgi:hypothetical protein
LGYPIVLVLVQGGEMIGFVVFRHSVFSERKKSPKDRR